MLGATHERRTVIGPREALAPARSAVRGLPATGPRLRLARAVPHEPATPGTVVLLDDLPGSLDLRSQEALRG